MPNYRFILESFGLAYLKPKLYFNHKPLEQNASNYPAMEDQPEEFQTLGGDESPTSLLGTPVFCQLKLSDINDENLITIDTVLIDISQTKNIVKTIVQGRKGTVKEYISLGDYQVTIRGAIVGKDMWKYPQSDVALLKRILEIEKEIKCISEYLQIFGIYNLAVESYRFPQREGFQNMQLFEITASQDEPIELKVE